jgi:mRNA-degrading endonuclease RelE of RelBE toxin-antitoxin system
LAGAPKYTFAYSDQALGFLDSLTNKRRHQVMEKIDRLALNTRPPGCKLVRGTQGGEEQVYRIRSGDYRVLYVVREAVIAILDVGHRKDIYGP